VKYRKKPMAVDAWPWPDYPTGISRATYVEVEEEDWYCYECEVRRDKISAYACDCAGHKVERITIKEM